ncbi:MAG TPA: S41 family peptidase, partial [Thermoanaerobaculia bacterium]|nr:S41 family peptidase [Thermoanaerobaculia bacterium]
GKSVVQKFIQLPSGGGVYMTIAHYTTPELKPIKDGGVRPDVIVDLTAQVLRDPNAKDEGTPKKPQPDVILEKALQLFSEPAAAKKAA